MGKRKRSLSKAKSLSKEREVEIIKAEFMQSLQKEIGVEVEKIKVMIREQILGYGSYIPVLIESPHLAAILKAFKISDEGDLEALIEKINAKVDQGVQVMLERMFDEAQESGEVREPSEAEINSMMRSAVSEVLKGDLQVDGREIQHLLESRSTLGKGHLMELNAGKGQKVEGLEGEKFEEIMRGLLDFLDEEELESGVVQEVDNAYLAHVLGEVIESEKEKS